MQTTLESNRISLERIKMHEKKSDFMLNRDAPAWEPGNTMNPRDAERIEEEEK